MPIDRRAFSWLLLIVVLPSCAEEPRVGVVDVEQAFQRSPLAMMSTSSGWISPSL